MNVLLENLLSPMVLCFVLGVGASLLRSDLRVPQDVYSALTIYLLLAIGLKGGVALSSAPLAELLLPLLVTLLLGLTIPMWVYALCIRVGKLDPANSGALAAHYGSVSAVTFIAALSFVAARGLEAEGYLPTLLATLEIPGIAVGLLLARRHSPRAAASGESADGAPAGESLGRALSSILTGKSVYLLLGGLTIGALMGESQFAKISVVFRDPFNGILCLFLLELGMIAAARFSEVRQAGPFILGLALLTPPIHGALGVSLGLLSGLSVGGATVLGAMAASASYIAAPAAVRVALPQASPSLYLTAALGLTFPFNLTVGLPLYAALAGWLEGVL